MPNDHLSNLGIIALGSRLRRLSDLIMAQGRIIYHQANVDFEPGWFPLFSFVDKVKSASVAESAEALGLSHAAIIQTIRPLVKQGLLTQVRSPGDRRKTLLSLTASGMEMADSLRPLWNDIRQACEGLFEDSNTTFTFLGLVESLEQSLKQGKLAEGAVHLIREREMDTLEVVPFEKKYAYDFSRLNYHWIEKYFHIEPGDRIILDHPEASIMARGGEILFARIGLQIVATCALKADGPNQYEVTKMAVHEDYRGRGIGQELLRAVISHARDIGAERLHIETNTVLANAIHLYEKAGFKHYEPVGGGQANNSNGQYSRSNCFLEMFLM